MLSATISHAQMMYWTTPSLKFNMSTTTPLSTVLPGPEGAYSVANGVYDDNGNILFYVRDYDIYGPTGQIVGELPWYDLDVCEEAYTYLNLEINIVPIPGTCREYYVIYSMDNPIGYSPVLYVKVNCSGISPFVTYNGWYHSGCEGHTGNVPFNVIWHGGADNTGMAVSKLISGSTEKRFLFSVSNGDIVRIEITGSGISAGTTIVTAAQLRLQFADFHAYEAELSWGTNYFAWSSANGMVHVIRLTADGEFVAGSLQSYSIPGAKGIEFTMHASNPKLYADNETGNNQAEELVVYPIPASEEITVQFNNLTEENYQIDVMDMTGRQVLLLLPNTKIEKGIFEKSFNISILRSGIYSYRVKSATCTRSGLISKY